MPKSPNRIKLIQKSFENIIYGRLYIYRWLINNLQKKYFTFYYTVNQNKHKINLGYECIERFVNQNFLK